MTFKNFLTASLMLLVFSIAFTSCEEKVELRETTYNYAFNANYGGTHANSLTADVMLNEMEDGTTKITVTLNNAINGEEYPVHVHDADASQPNGYNPSPNAAILATMITASGTTATTEVTSQKSYLELTNDYDGFFVVHDPLQAVDVTDPATFVVVDAFPKK